MNKDLKFIKDFSKITIKKACKETGVNISNMWTGKTKDAKIRLVRDYITCMVFKLLIEYLEDE